jgi:hypothetical protein
MPFEPANQSVTSVLFIGADGKLDWIGLDWIGLDWIGLDWIGLDWIGLDWIGLDSLGCSYMVPPRIHSSLLCAGRAPVDVVVC